MSMFLHDGRPTWRSAREVWADLSDLGLTIQAVTACVRAAVNEGLVTPEIRLPAEQKDVMRLANAVRNRFRLDQVLLVPGLPQMLTATDRDSRRGIQARVLSSMARKVVTLLDTLIEQMAEQHAEACGSGAEPRPVRLGVAWGRTMYEICEKLAAEPRLVQLKQLEVLPIIGITSNKNKDPLEANIVAMRIATAYGGEAEQLPCPAFLDPYQYHDTIKLPQVRDMLSKIRGCDIVVTGMGPIVSDTTDGSADITLSNDPEMNRQLVDEALRAGAIGEICYWLFNDRGDRLKVPHCAIGLGLNGLSKIAHSKGRKVVLVVGGDRRRFKPLEVALKSGLANVLVSDTCTARSLVGEADRG